MPRSDFVGYPLKILEPPGMVVILYEAVHAYRQIFTDGRALPKDPNPNWFGYSIGRWEGDVLVVESSGFNDNVWLDNAGRPATEALKVTERFVRKNFGQMDIEITIDDPKAYTKPWSVTQQLAFQPDTELLEYICNENNKVLRHHPEEHRALARRRASERHPARDRVGLSDERCTCRAVAPTPHSRDPSHGRWQA